MYSERGLENQLFKKEMAIRHRILNIYNKREEDFPSLRDYNDYLEQVEDMTFNLIDGRDVAAIEAQIAQYQKENAEQIMNSQARKAEELAAALAASKGLPKQADDDVMMNHQGSVGAGTQGQYAPTIVGGAMGQPRPTQPLPIGSNNDMQAYHYDDEEMTRLRAERGGRAGGWSIEMSRKRSLEEAFSTIWV